MSQISNFSFTNVGLANIQIDESTGRVVAVDITGNANHIGFSVKAYSELKKLAEEAMTKTEEYKKKAEEYEQKLVEAGLIQKPMSQDEQMANLISMMGTLTETVSKMGTELTTLKGRVDGLPKTPITRTNHPSE